MQLSSYLYTAIPEGEIKLENQYRPLQTLDGTDFSTQEIQLDLQHPVDILAQPTYDGSVNLILTDDKNPVRIINTGFAKREGDICEIIERMGDEPTNNYEEGNIDLQTKLFTTVNIYPTILLDKVETGGNMMGGNYTFYFRYADEDDNLTDIVGESGIVSLFNGDWTDISGITGTLLDERTDKTVTLKLTNVDPRFNKVYVYFQRNTSDLNGIQVNKTYKITDPFKLSEETTIFLTGYEELEEISSEELNFQYNIYNTAKTQAVTQNMLFLGNLTTNNVDSKELDNIAKSVVVSCVQEGTIGNIDINTYKEKTTSSQTNRPGEYYNPLNIYDRLGYWPDEFYRFGMVFIFKDGSYSNVYNLKGGWLKELNSSEFEGDSNEWGVFRTPKVPIIPDTSSSKSQAIKPIAFKFQVADKTGDSWDKIAAYFFVRQNRIPITIAQGFTVGVNRTTGIPTPLVYQQNVMPKVKEDKKDLSGETFVSKTITGNYYQFESFIGHIKETTQQGHETYPWSFAVAETGKEWVPDLSNNITRRIVPIYCQTLGFDATVYTDPESGEYGKQFLEQYKNSTLHFGMLCVEASCVMQLQSLFGGLLYYLQPAMAYYKDGKSLLQYERTRIPNVLGYFNLTQTQQHKAQLLNISPDTSTRIVKHKDNKTFSYLFSTKVGSSDKANDVEDACSDIKDPSLKQIVANKTHLKEGQDTCPSLVRGHFTPFIGIVPTDAQFKEIKTAYEGVSSTSYYGKDVNTKPSCIYNIRTINLDDNSKTVLTNEIIKREHDNSPFYAVSDRINVGDQQLNSEHVIYRGDCFASTVTVRMQRNFTDPEIELSDTFADPRTWAKYFYGHWNVGEPKAKEKDINRADINSVQMGYWLTYKCLSNYNIGLRSEDKTHTEEINKIGNHRSFYPVRGFDVSSACKLPDSYLFNLGYSRTLPAKKYFAWEETPYENVDYANRIAFSNVQVDKAFTNSFRVFQALSYQDIDASYGAIVKILPFKSDLFCVFEHGCGIVPINEKALMQTTTGQNIHIYGSDVIGKQLTVVSPHYGSTWKDSIIWTPNGIYGVDTSANKIWRFDSYGFRLISDMRVQRFLNENMNLVSDELMVGVNNVKTHYNHHKSDVMFTFYSGENIWNLCYNEILDLFTCKYTWTPLLSENIDSTYYSFNMDPKDNKYQIYKHNSGDRLPTNWYGEQHPFEFEFVVATPFGVHKIFDNLNIISNNVEPNSLEIEIVGDVYSFKEDCLKHNVNFPEIKYAEESVYKTELKEDLVTKETGLRMSQKCLNIKDYGRRLGNIEYKEDMWYTTLAPIISERDGVQSQARIRDKYAKIRVKYTGDKLSVITAIQSLISLSYA